MAEKSEDAGAPAARGSKRGARKKRGKAASESELRLRTDPRSERRFEPTSSIGVVLSMIGMSLGAVVVGAGTYGQWLRGEELGPYPYAPWMLGAGAVVFLLVAIFGQRLAKPVRVGDAGVAVENDANDIDRIAWCDVVRILAGPTMITVQSNGRSITVPVSTLRSAASRLLFEARARVPSHVEGELELPAPSDEAGEILTLEAPQVAGQRCKASERLISFERDARLCGRCGEVYHKDGVPRVCLTCEAPLT